MKTYSYHYSVYNRMGNKIFSNSAHYCTPIPDIPNTILNIITEHSDEDGEYYIANDDPTNVNYYNPFWSKSEQAVIISIAKNRHRYRVSINPNNIAISAISSTTEFCVTYIPYELFTIELFKEKLTTFEKELGYAPHNH